MLIKETLGNEVCLVETKQDLSLLVKEFKSFDVDRVIGIDTETTGLDYVKDKIVGYCLATDYGSKYRGFYIPIRHDFYDGNFPPGYVGRFVGWILRRFKTVFFNRSYDFFMMENEGIEIPVVTRSHDVQIMAWEATSDRLPSLKGYYKKFCKKEAPTYTETISKTRTLDEIELNYNFALTDPRTSFTYAALDPVITLELGRALFRLFPFIKKIYPLDNRVSEVVRRQSKIDVCVDYDAIAPFKEQVEVEMRGVKSDIFKMTGYQFNLNSSREKAEALSRFVTLSEKTGTGQFSVKSDVLSRINHPLAKMMVRYAELSKFTSSYITPLESSRGKSTKFNWNLVNTPTGRLSCGGTHRNSYYIPYNLQSIPVEQQVLYVHTHPVLGYHLTCDKEGALGECEAKSGFRRVFSAPEGYCFMSFDFRAEEVRLMANIAQEHVWADAFNRDEDVHMKVAELVFGEKTKKARSAAKAITFGLAYGMSTPSLAKRLDVPISRAEEIVNQYFKSLINFKKWINYQKSYAHKKMRVFDYFGRSRNLEPYYNTSEPSRIAFGDRVSVNSVIQSTGADILRLKLCKLFDLWDRDKDFHDNVIIPFSVHDEVNFYVRYGYMEKALELIPKIMYEMHDNWLCPLVVDSSIGTSWGTLIGDPVVKDGKIVDAKSIQWYEGTA